MKDYGRTKLKSRGKAGFVISLVMFIIFLASCIGGSLAAVFVGNSAFRNAFGVSLFDVAACFGDLLGAPDRSAIVTNAYSDEDEKGFYTSLDSALYLKDGSVTEEYLADVVDSMMAGVLDGSSDDTSAENPPASEPGTETPGDQGAVVSSASSDESGEQTGGAEEPGEDTDVTDPAEALTRVLRLENFDAAKLAAYDSTAAKPVTATMTDRQAAAFVNAFLFRSGRLDEMFGETAGELLGDVKISEVLALEQVTISAYKDLSDNDKLACAAKEGGVYFIATMSLDATKIVRTLVDKTPMYMLSGIAAASLPERLYITASADLKDINEGMRVDVNGMAREECKMDAVPAALADKYGEKLTKFDRLCIIVEAFSGTDLNALINEAAGTALEFICEGGEGSFAFADLIDTDSVTVTEKGNSFAVDAYGLVALMLSEQSGTDATATDLLRVLQSLVCTDAEDALALSDRVDIYTDDMTKLQTAMAECGITSVEDIDTAEDLEKLAGSGATVVVPAADEAPPAGYVSIYRDLTVNAVAAAYGISLENKPSGGTYTYDDIVSVMGYPTDDPDALASMSEDQRELVTRIAEAAEQGEGTGVFSVTDKMLGAAVRDMTELFGTGELADYAFSVRSMKLVEMNGKTYVETVATISLSGIADGSYIDGVLPSSIAVGVRIDLTDPATGSRDKAVMTAFNGIGENGGPTGIEELTCGMLLDSVKRIVPEFDVDAVLTSVSDAMGDVVRNLTEYFPDYEFVPSVA